MEDHHVDRPGVEAWQHVKLTGTNRSIGLTLSQLPSGKREQDHPPPQRQVPEIRSPALARYNTRQQLLTNTADTHVTNRDMQGQAFPHTTRSQVIWFLVRPGGYSEGQYTRFHSELGRENPQRQWYCVLRRGRVGRRQA